ncbi:hypothetical protein, partial [Lysobacter sp. Root690]|uniref:hypothetical protein n=1 Tax=Lysobacter sp. Root690 TaxID=1736588 RepID=UPI001F32844B
MPQRVVDLVAVVAAHVLLHHGAAERVVGDFDRRLDTAGDQLSVVRVDLAGVGEDRADLVAAVVVLVTGDARAPAVGIFEATDYIAQCVVFGAGGDSAHAIAVGARDVDVGDPHVRTDLRGAAAGGVVFVVPDASVLVAECGDLAQRVVGVLLVLVERVGDAHHPAHRVVGRRGLAHVGDAGDRGRYRGFVHRRDDGNVSTVAAGFNDPAGAIKALFVDRAQIVDGETHATGGVEHVLGRAVFIGAGVGTGRVQGGVDVGRCRHRAE